MYIAFPSLPAASLPVDLAPEDLQEAVVPCSTPTLPCVVLGIPCQRLLTLEQPCAGKILGRGIMLRWVLLLNPPAALKSCLSWGGICKGDADGMGAIDNASHPGGAGSRLGDKTEIRQCCLLDLAKLSKISFFWEGEKYQGSFHVSHGFACMTKGQGIYCPWPSWLNPRKTRWDFAALT